MTVRREAVEGQEEDWLFDTRGGSRRRMQRHLQGIKTKAWQDCWQKGLLAEGLLFLQSPFINLCLASLKLSGNQRALRCV